MARKKGQLRVRTLPIARLVPRSSNLISGAKSVKQAAAILTQIRSTTLHSESAGYNEKIFLCDNCFSFLVNIVIDSR